MGVGRIGFAALLSALVSGVCGCAPAPATPADARPDVVLVTIEALRADRLGSYGFPLDTTPVMDGLAASGVRFERAIAASNRPAQSLASILTSTFPRDPARSRTGRDGVASLAQLLGAAGYETAAFVTGPVLSDAPDLEAGFGVVRVVSAGSEGHPADASARAVTREALAWLEGEGEGPFFLWVHYRDPHGPYTPLPRDRGRFRVRPEADAKPLEVLADESGRGGIPASQALSRARYPSEYESRQADEIRATDQQLGVLLESVDAHRSGRPAVIAVTGAFGEALGENDRWFVHDHATTPDVAWVPFLLRAPGLAPTVRAESVHHVDIAPTLLDLAGLVPPPSARGLALAPRLRGELPFPERRVYCDMGSELSAYDATGYTRATGLDAGTPPEWSAWAWHPEMSPIRLPDPDPESLPPDLLDYARLQYPPTP